MRKALPPLARTIAVIVVGTPSATVVKVSKPSEPGVMTAVGVA